MGMCPAARSVPGRGPALRPLGVAASDRPGAHGSPGLSARVAGRVHLGRRRARDQARITLVAWLVSHLVRTRRHAAILSALAQRFWVEHNLWGDATLGYHLVNILLHAAAAVLVALVLRRLSVPGAYLAAALFALHPVHVESVAWITEQKNTLSAMFYLGAMLVYLRFDQARKTSLYWWALGLFVLGLMSKTTAATLPAALLVIFWWQRGRLSWHRDVRPLAPFFVLGLLAGLLTAWVERKLIGAEGDGVRSDVRGTLPAGRPGHLVLSGQALLAHGSDFHLPSLAGQPGRLVAISISGGGVAVVGWIVGVAATVARTAGGIAFLRRHALAGIGILQRVSVHIFFRGRSFPVFGELGGDYFGLSRCGVAAGALGALASSGRIRGLFGVVGNVGDFDLAAEPDV